MIKTAGAGALSEAKKYPWGTLAPTLILRDHQNPRPIVNKFFTGCKILLNIAAKPRGGEKFMIY